MKKCKIFLLFFITVFYCSFLQGQQQAKAMSIMEIISSRPEFSKFKVAVILAQLDTLLSYRQSLTVFAPDNAAFDKLSPESLQFLYNPKNFTALLNFVKRHIILQEISPSSLDHLKLHTFQGKSFTIFSIPAGHYIDGVSKINLPPLIGSNGLIYRIDSVL
jgi:uncharacterized surface protein with fasciclin (FAS1) repeats